jgi:3-deoxy-D-manno-octulosonic-acid transferase
MLSLYAFLTDIAAGPLRALLRIRAWRGKEEPLRLAERRGLSALHRPEGAVVWCHAASVGESLALLPLIQSLMNIPGTYVLLTTGTATSARLMAERLPTRVIHQFDPMDRRGWISRFLGHWQPNIAVRMESELWPNTLVALKDGDVPVVIINGRLSDSTVKGWTRFPGAAKSVMNCVDLVLAQSKEHAEKFRRLGARQVETAPNLKLAAPPLPVNQKTLASLRSLVGDRPLWLAASTHPGEEDIIFSIHKTLAKKHPDLLTMIAPRHPHRGPEIAKQSLKANLETAQRSAGQDITSATSIYVADTLGELGSLFTVAPIVFMGKSLTVRNGAKGGQNPIEPAHFECAIVFGPHMENFDDVAAMMVREKMALQVANENELAVTLGTLLDSSEDRRVMALSAKQITVSGSDALAVVIAAVQRHWKAVPGVPDHG